MKTKVDIFASHNHVPQMGAPYDWSKAITCQDCIDMLVSSMTAHRESLSKKHKLPPHFWDGIKFSWE